jgi:hypothetical protein
MASNPPGGPPRTRQTLGGGLASYINPSQTSATIDPFILHYIDAKVDKAKAEMNAEVSRLESTIANAEAQRTVDYKTISDGLRDVQTKLPTTTTIWKAAGATVVGLIAAAALTWQIFTAGGGFTGSFAQQILSSKEAAQAATRQSAIVNDKLDKLLSAKKEPGIIALPAPSASKKSAQ